MSKLREMKKRRKENGFIVAGTLIVEGVGEDVFKKTQFQSMNVEGEVYPKADDFFEPKSSGLHPLSENLFKFKDPCNIYDDEYERFMHCIKVLKGEEIAEKKEIEWNPGVYNAEVSDSFDSQKKSIIDSFKRYHFEMPIYGQVFSSNEEELEKINEVSEEKNRNIDKLRAEASEYIKRKKAEISSFEEELPY